MINRAPSLASADSDLRGLSPTPTASKLVREGVQAFLQRGAGNVERIDRIRLAALPRAPAALRCKVRRDPQPPLATPDENPLKRPGNMTAVLQRPPRAPSRRRAHRNSASNPRR